MKIHILGSAAYERVPAMFCDCAVCEHARKHGGKEIRTQAQVLIDDDLLVDFGQDNFYHVMQYGLDFKKIKNILITHSHTDHFMPNELMMTKEPYGYNDMQIHIYGGEDCYEKYLTNSNESKTAFTVVEAYQTFAVGKYTVTALPARHGTQNPFVYVITDGEKTIFYDNDSGVEFDEVFDFLKEKQYVFDVVLVDGTLANNHEYGFSGHKSFQDIVYQQQRLAEQGNVTDKTRWVVTHFSHNGLMGSNGQPMSHDDLNDFVGTMDMEAAYDGMVITA